MTEIEKFIEQMGLHAQDDGLPRIAGRMIGFFMAHGGPFSFSEVAEQLQISRGSVSSNARILRQLGMIELTTIPGDRQDYFQLTDQPFTRLLEGYMERMQGVEKTVQTVLQSINADQHSARDRLHNMSAFYSKAVANTQRLIDELNEPPTVTPANNSSTPSQD